MVSLFCPSEFDLATRTQSLVELARVVLDIANGDELRFEFVNAKLMESRRGLEVQVWYLSGYLLFDICQVPENLFLRKRGGAGGLGVAFRADEVLSGGLQV